MFPSRCKTGVVVSLKRDNSPVLISKVVLASLAIGPISQVSRMIF
jgi:hypothetical protein